MQSKLYCVHSVFHTCYLVFVWIFWHCDILATVWYDFISIQCNQHLFVCILYFIFGICMGISSLRHTGNWYGMLSVQNNAIWTLLCTAHFVWHLLQSEVSFVIWKKYWSYIVQLNLVWLIQNLSNQFDINTYCAHFVWHPRKSVKYLKSASFGSVFLRIKCPIC